MAGDELDFGGENSANALIAKYLASQGLQLSPENRRQAVEQSARGELIIPGLQTRPTDIGRSPLDTALDRAVATPAPRGGAAVASSPGGAVPARGRGVATPTITPSGTPSAPPATPGALPTPPGLPGIHPDAQPVMPSTGNQGAVNDPPPWSPPSGNTIDPPPVQPMPQSQDVQATDMPSQAVMARAPDNQWDDLSARVTNMLPQDYSGYVVPGAVAGGAGISAYLLNGVRRGTNADANTAAQVARDQQSAQEAAVAAEAERARAGSRTTVGPQPESKMTTVQNQPAYVREQQRQAVAEQAAAQARKDAEAAAAKEKGKPAYGPRKAQPPSNSANATSNSAPVDAPKAPEPAPGPRTPAPGSVNIADLPRYGANEFAGPPVPGPAPVRPDNSLERPAFERRGAPLQGQVQPPYQRPTTAGPSANVPSAPPTPPQAAPTVGAPNPAAGAPVAGNAANVGAPTPTPANAPMTAPVRVSPAAVGAPVQTQYPNAPPAPQPADPLKSALDKAVVTEHAMPQRPQPVSPVAATPELSAADALASHLHALPDAEKAAVQAQTGRPIEDIIAFARSDPRIANQVWGQVQQVYQQVHGVPMPAQSAATAPSQAVAPTDVQAPTPTKATPAPASAPEPVAQSTAAAPRKTKGGKPPLGAEPAGPDAAVRASVDKAVGGPTKAAPMASSDLMEVVSQLPDAQANLFRNKMSLASRARGASLAQMVNADPAKAEELIRAMGPEALRAIESVTRVGRGLKALTKVK